MVRPTTASPPAPPVRDPAATALRDYAAAAEYLAVNERMVRRLVENRRLPYVKVGKHVRFRQADLDAYITAQVVEATA